MEADAFASYVALDMELQQPLLVLGVLSDMQYADMDDPPAAPAPPPPPPASLAPAAASARHFRHSLELLKRAVQYWKAEGGVSFVAMLGNALAAENVPSERQWSALESFDDARGRVGAPFHLTPGEHDLRCFGTAQLHRLTARHAPLHYSFVACAGWRVLLLDSYDISLLAHPPGSAAYMDVLALLQEHNANPPDAADPLHGLEGDERRWSPTGGGVGRMQLDWLSAQLAAAAAAGERVVLLSRLGWLPAACDPERLLFNFEDVQQRVDAYPGVTALVLFGGDGKGAYARDLRGVHHLSPCAACACDVNEDAFGVVRILENSIRVEMRGRAPDPERRPNGWPSELSFPTPNGTLVPALPGGGADGFGFILQMCDAFPSRAKGPVDSRDIPPTVSRRWLFLLHTIMLPMQPVFRLLTSSSSERDEGVAPSRNVATPVDEKSADAAAEAGEEAA